MTAALRRGGERGQSILVGVVGLIVLAIAMYTTYNLSRTVYEKIQLQNAADATAYSLATLEARTFNFIAFANRAQIANYVQMMESQSLLSNAYFLEGMLIKLHWLAALGAKFPPASAVLQPAATALNSLRLGMTSAADLLEVTQPRFVEKQTTINKLLYGASLMLVVSTAMQIGGGGEAIAKENDPDAEYSGVSHAFSVLNELSFMTAFSKTSFGLGSQSDKAAHKRVMAELANASRITKGEKKFIVDRDMLSYFNQSLSGFLPAWLDPSAAFTGSTKLLTPNAQRLADVDDIDKMTPEHSALARGDALVARDRLSGSDWLDIPIPGLGKVLGRMVDSLVGVDASVISTPDLGERCRYDWRNPKGRAICRKSGSLRWQDLLRFAGGITPYVAFAPKLAGVGSERYSFNQPEVWVFLSKDVAAMRLKEGRPEPALTLTFKGDKAKFEGDIGKKGLLGSGKAPGMHALSRAQVYYHRPGAWQEPPNLFNPYWAARLAPKNAALNRLLKSGYVPEAVAELIGDNVTMF